MASVEKGINALKGINEVAITLVDSTAMVKYDASKLELEEIERAIEEHGYSVKHLE